MVDENLRNSFLLLTLLLCAVFPFGTFFRIFAPLYIFYWVFKNDLSCLLACFYLMLLLIDFDLIDDSFYFWTVLLWKAPVVNLT